MNRATTPQELRERFHVDELALFGSWARGDQTEHSDVDILVTLSAPVGWEFVELQQYLEQLLGRKVDLLTHEAARRKTLLWRYIEKDVVRV